MYVYMYSVCMVRAHAWYVYVYVCMVCVCMYCVCVYVYMYSVYVCVYMVCVCVWCGQVMKQLLKVGSLFLLWNWGIEFRKCGRMIYVFLYPCSLQSDFRGLTFKRPRFCPYSMNWSWPVDQMISGIKQECATFLPDFILKRP